MAQSPEHIDIELAQPQNSQTWSSSSRLQGYPTFADFIAADADAAIYRRFESLSARNLLYLQSELHELEAELNELDAIDVKERKLRNQEAEKIARFWLHYSKDDNERATRHRELQGKIRAKLKQYHEALVLESQVLRLSTPTPRVLQAFQRWFWSSASPVLWGRDRDLFTNEGDLVALAPVETDRLNIFLQNYFGWFLKEKRKKVTGLEDDDLFYFPARRIQRAGAVISIFLSAILLIGAILCLEAAARDDSTLRVGLIVLFTCLFAAVVGLLTNARRAEIFASTAAYAAVLCVFVNKNP